uniref:PNPLA domain-containing protein n=1 Tax=Salmo trutta TaxID=8032 RepID=A0A674EM51_SALTR
FFLLGSLRECAGAQVAAVMITAPDKLEICQRCQRVGAVTPGYNFMLTPREDIEEFLPGDAHSKAGNRLHISITHSKSGKNTILSSLASREDLIKVALLASSCVPVYAGIKLVEWQGQKWIDGGFTDSLPILSEGSTITVSPVAGPQDICQKHRGLMNLPSNWLKPVLIPPLEERMNQYCKEGHDDAVMFLKKKWLFELCKFFSPSEEPFNFLRS